MVSIDAILETMRWDGGSFRLFLRANIAAARLARPHLRDGRTVIFDGNFYWQRAIDDLRRRLGCPMAVVTLRLPLRLCIERDRARAQPYGAEAARAVFAKSRRVSSGVKVDARGTVDQVADRVLAVIRDSARYAQPMVRARPRPS